LAFRGRWVARIAVLAAILLLIGISAPVWLPWVGRALMDASAPKKADVALVLAGDYDGRRILEAAQLVREGYVPRVLVSGPRSLYGFYECDLAIPFAVKRGFPEEYFVRAPNEGRSTREESHAMAAQLRAMGVKSLILVTSDYHTRRSGRLMRSAAPDLAISVVAAPNADWELRRWWQHREGQKAVFMEWTKTITGYFGI
jgi:uncharacterized SAM-binding protein YcdF (DUF218 family)